jgi:small-conductance mechanosensitive channel/CRP-like cAMP-binding protein
VAQSPAPATCPRFIPVLEKLITTLLHGETTTSGIAILVGGLSISLILRAVVAPVHRARLATPTRLLVAGTLSMIALEYLERGSRLQRWLTVAPVALLLLAFGRLLSIGVFDWLFARRFQRDAPRILRDIVDGLFSVIALLGTLAAMGVEPGSLITTSAVLTAVLGLSLQDTLGNLFAGLSLQAQQPFSVGDWIQIDREGTQVGRVLEINWRATRIITESSQELTIPNGQLARGVILNHSRQREGTERTVRVLLPYEVATQRVHDVLQAATRSVPGILALPLPRIETGAFAEHGIRYELQFYIDDFGRRLQIESAVRDRVWYALSRARIAFATAPRGVPLEAAAPSAREPDARSRAIREIDFLRDLPDSAIDELARAARTELYAPGEMVVRQGDHGEELYLCLRGELVVLHQVDPGPLREVARLHEGGMFGEFAQLTGEVRAASVQTVSACELAVVPKAAFAQLLLANPALAELIGQRLAERRAELDAIEPKTGEKRSSVDERKGQFVRRLREFFMD